MSHIFTYKCGHTKHDVHDVEITIMETDPTLEELCQVFVAYLRACQFEIYDLIPTMDEEEHATIEDSMESKA